MPPEVDHVGKAGVNGCTFVEGHKALSPTIAKRFLDRGTIVRAGARDKDAFNTTDRTGLKGKELMVSRLLVEETL